MLANFAGCSIRKRAMLCADKEGAPRRFSHSPRPAQIARIQRQPQAARREINTLPKRIAWRHGNPIAVLLEIAAKGLPAKLRMIDNISRRIEGVAEEVRAVIAAIGIPFERRRKRVKRRGREAFLVNIGQRAIVPP